MKLETLNLKPETPRTREKYVSWSNHVNDEANIVRVEQEKAARKAEDLRRAAQKFIESSEIPPTVDKVRRYVETLNGQSIDGDTPLIPLIPERFSIDADALREILTLPGNGENIPPGAATINPILLPPKP